VNASTLRGDARKTDKLTVVKAHDLLCRRGVIVPGRTLHRYALEVCDVGRGRRGSTVRVNDGEPGDELQVDFGKMGLVFDVATGRRRVCHALIFTACVSRHCFVWLTFRQTLDDVIAGFEAAWVFFGGVFKTVIPDNMKTIVEHADALEPRLNQAFIEYAQARGFVIDPARVRSPQDKALVSYCTSCCRFDEDSLGELAAHAFDEPRVAGRGRLVEPLVLVVGFVGDEQASAMPGLDRAGVNPQMLSDLIDGEQPTGPEALSVAGELMRAA
jgi:hypothetical protein